MPVTQTNILHAVTANVIQGMQRKGNFAALDIAQPIEQFSLSANWPVIELDDNFGIQDLLESRAPGAGFKQVDSQIKLDNSTVKGDGCEVVVDKSIMSDAEKSGLNALSAYGAMLMSSALIRHESRVAALAQGSDFDSTNSTVAYTSANSDSADPAEDIQAAIERVNGRGENADAIVIPIDVWTRIRRFDKLISFIAGTVNPASQVTATNLARAFAEEGIRRVIIARGRVNNAAKGKAASIASIWDTSHIWVGSIDAAAETGDANSLGMAMATFYNAEHPAPFFIETYPSDSLRSEVLRVFGETNAKVINAKAGTRIATQFS